MSTRITDLPQAETLNGSEIMPLVQNGVTKKATLDFINLAAPAALILAQTQQVYADTVVVKEATDAVLVEAQSMVNFQQAGAGAVVRTMQDKAREVVSVKDFGAVGDGATDDTQAIQNALNSSSIVVLDPTGRYLIDSDHLHIPHRKALIGAYEHRSTTGKDWTVFGGALVLNPNYSVIVKNGSQLKGCVIIRKGITGIIEDGEASFSGYAVIADEGDGYIGHNAIIGFEYGVYNGPLSRNGFEAVSRARPRVIVEDNAIDCINGIVLGTASDPDKIRRNHLWPYTSPVVGDNHLRSGVGIKLYERHDHTQMRDNVVYGYQIGYLFENTQNVVSINDFYDTVRTELLLQPKTSIGMMITGTPGIEFTHVQLTLICPQISAANKGIYQSVPNGQFTVIESPAIFAQETHAIEVVGGDMDIHGGFLTNTVASSNGLAVNNAASQVRHNGLRFVNYPTEASKVVKLAGVVRAFFAREVFAETDGDNTLQYVRSSGSGGIARLILDHEGNTGAVQLTHYSTSNTVGLSVGGVDAFRASTTGTGIGTALPRARFHSLGSNIIGLGTAGVADTLLDDNAGPQLSVWLDEANNKLMFKVIYSGAADDTGRTVKSGEMPLV